MNNGTDPALHEHLEARGDIQYIKMGKCSFAQAVNVGIKAGIGDYVLILNDDVIASKGWLGEMVKACQGDVGAVGPLSNCDKGWLHNEEIILRGEKVGVGLPIDWLDHARYEDLCVYAERRPVWKETCSVLHVAFYSTFIDAQAVRALGYLDESMKTTHSDFEYCDRATHFGYKVSWDMSSFIFHFGAVARKIDEKTDHGAYHGLEEKDREQYYKNRKKTVLLISGPSWEKWSVNNLYEGGIGGSETCLIHLGRNLVKHGYNVTSIIDSEREEFVDGVEYIPFDKVQWGDLFGVDTVISSRVPEIINVLDKFDNFDGVNKILWCHDITFSKDRVECAKRFNDVVVLSDWHKEFWQKNNNSDLRYTVIPDGVDLGRFRDVSNEHRYGRFVWGSSWDRGLDNLVFILANLKAEFKDIRLDVYYGDYNLLKTIQATGNKKLKQFHEFMVDNMKNCSWIKVHDRIDQNRLAEEYSRAYVWLYPTYFQETCCITALEMMAAGLPIIHNGYAGLGRYRDTGVLIDNYPSSMFFGGVRMDVMDQYIKATRKLLKDPVMWRELSQASLAKAQNYSWSKVVKERWLPLIGE